MFTFLALKMKNPALAMSFSKLKIPTMGSKQNASALKSPPQTLKRPPIPTPSQKSSSSPSILKTPTPKATT